MQAIIRRKGARAAVNDTKGYDGPYIPVCSNCNRIRRWGVWTSELWDGKQKATHGLCDRCGEKLYGKEFWDEVRKGL